MVKTKPQQSEGVAGMGIFDWLLNHTEDDEEPEPVVEDVGRGRSGTGPRHLEKAF